MWRSGGSNDASPVMHIVGPDVEWLAGPVPDDLETVVILTSDGKERVDPAPQHLSRRSCEPGRMKVCSGECRQTALGAALRTYATAVRHER
jgi:hypothetical protein